jgi:hypothetical protein
MQHLLVSTEAPPRNMKLRFYLGIWDGGEGLDSENA